MRISRFIKKFIKFNILYKTICYVLCLMGCVYQTYKISLLYFSYETTTDVRFEWDSNPITHQTITVCLDKRDLIRHLLRLKYGNNSRLLRKHINSQSIGQQF